MTDIPEYVIEASAGDPDFLDWYVKKEKYIEAHYTENPVLDTYVITLETTVQFARENDGVLNEDDVGKWLKIGEIDLDPGHRIIKIKKVE